jgi:hypothetical protein
MYDGSELDASIAPIRDWAEATQLTGKYANTTSTKKTLLNLELRARNPREIVQARRDCGYFHRTLIFESRVIHYGCVIFVATWELLSNMKARLRMRLDLCTTLLVIPLPAFPLFSCSVRQTGLSASRPRAGLQVV